MPISFASEVDIHDFTAHSRSIWDDLYYEEDELAEFRHHAFLIECGLEQEDDDDCSFGQDSIQSSDFKLLRIKGKSENATVSTALTVSSHEDVADAGAGAGAGADAGTSAMTDGLQFHSKSRNNANVGCARVLQRKHSDESGNSFGSRNSNSINSINSIGSQSSQSSQRRMGSSTNKVPSASSRIFKFESLIQQQRLKHDTPSKSNATTAHKDPKKKKKKNKFGKLEKPHKLESTIAEENEEDEETELVEDNASQNVIQQVEKNDPPSPPPTSPSQEQNQSSPSSIQKRIQLWKDRTDRNDIIPTASHLKTFASPPFIDCENFQDDKLAAHEQNSRSTAIKTPERVKVKSSQDKKSDDKSTKVPGKSSTPTPPVTTESRRQSSILEEGKKQEDTVAAATGPFDRDRKEFMCTNANAKLNQEKLNDSQRSSSRSGSKKNRDTDKHQEELNVSNQSSSSNISNRKPKHGKNKDELNISNRFGNSLDLNESMSSINSKSNRSRRSKRASKDSMEKLKAKRKSSMHSPKNDSSSEDDDLLASQDETNSSQRSFVSTASAGDMNSSQRSFVSTASAGDMNSSQRSLTPSSRRKKRNDALDKAVALSSPKTCLRKSVYDHNNRSSSDLKSQSGSNSPKKKSLSMPVCTISPTVEETPSPRRKLRKTKAEMKQELAAKAAASSTSSSSSLSLSTSPKKKMEKSKSVENIGMPLLNHPDGQETATKSPKTPSGSKKKKVKSKSAGSMEILALPSSPMKKKKAKKQPSDASGSSASSPSKKTGTGKNKVKSNSVGSIDPFMTDFKKETKSDWDWEQTLQTKSVPSTPTSPGSKSKLSSSSSWLLKRAAMSASPSKMGSRRTPGATEHLLSRVAAALQDETTQTGVSTTLPLNDLEPGDAVATKIKTMDHPSSPQHRANLSSTNPSYTIRMKKKARSKAALEQDAAAAAPDSGSHGLNTEITPTPEMKRSYSGSMLEGLDRTLKRRGARRHGPIETPQPAADNNDRAVIRTPKRSSSLKMRKSRLDG